MYELPPPPSNVLELLKSILLLLIRSEGLSTTTGTVMLLRAELTRTVGVFFVSRFPTIHRAPFKVMVGLPEISKSQGIFLGPMVVLALMIYFPSVQVASPPENASVFHCSI